MIRAAFIGVDRYDDPGIGDLTGAARDAKALWAVFKDSIDGIDAELLTDSAATLEGIETALSKALDTANDEDIVIIGFAGHGTPDHRLVAADTQTSDIPGTTISMENLADRFRKAKAKVVIVLLDCCFSGGAPARVLDVGVRARSLTVPLSEVAGRGRILFAASAPDEPALEDHETRHGLFTMNRAGFAGGSKS
jgi:uncharacterized caspase-like protein